MTRYYIEQNGTGLFYLDGTFEQEPEFFGIDEALRIAAGLGAPWQVTIKSTVFGTEEV